MEHPILGPEVERYLESLVPPPDPVRAEMEALAAAQRFPIIGALSGRLLELLARTSGARRVFEMGSGFGYSAYWFARALPADGELVLTDFSAERSAQARDFLRRAGVRCLLSFEVGDALEILRRPAQAGPWDVVFCDVEKAVYPEAAALALDRLRAGGLFVCDNALWSGRVVDAPADSPATAGVQAMNRFLAARPDVTSLVPLRDGVSVTVKV